MKRNFKQKILHIGSVLALAAAQLVGPLSPAVPSAQAVLNLANNMDASMVYFQSNFTSSSSGSTASKVYGGPNGLALDRAGQRLFVVDSGNHRVLVLNTDAAGVPLDSTADNVLGQPDFSTITSGTTQAKLRNPQSMAWDPTGHRLFVADYYNNRVMVWSLPGSVTNGMNASYVLGQPNFTTTTGTPATQARTYQPSNALWDDARNYLYVSDTSNSRVLVWSLTDTGGITNGMNAYRVLGQTGFADSGSAVSQNRLYGPWGLAADFPSNRLFVVDRGNNRVMVFDVGTITNGEAAVNVLGQADFTSFAPSLSQTRLELPYGLAWDEGDERLFVGDTDNNRVMAWDFDLGGAGITNGAAASYVLGQVNFTSEGLHLTAAGLNLPSALVYDDFKDLLYVGDASYNRLTVFGQTNNPPTADADSYGVVNGETLTVGAVAGVLANDDDPDLDSLTAQNPSTPTHGTLTDFNADGSFEYVADGAFVGPVTFTYEAFDGELADIATVTITVSTSPPAAADDSYTVAKGATLAVGAAAGVLANDSDLEDAITAVNPSTPAYGTLTEFNPDGSFEFAAPTGYVGPVTFTYEAFDGSSYDPATVTVSVASEDSTVENVVSLDRLAAGARGVGLAMSFGLQNTATGTLTVTFPAGFALNSAFTAGECSLGGSVGSFGLDGQTLTAEKLGCRGTLALSGASVDLPEDEGVYIVRWVNEDPGEAAVVVITADELDVRATVDPHLQFLAVAQLSAQPCSPASDLESGSFDYAVGFGSLNSAALNESGSPTRTVAEVERICTQASTNSAAGLAVTVESANGAAGLVSASTSDSIPSSTTGPIAPGDNRYGICVVAASLGSDAGSTDPASTDPSASGPFAAGHCAASAGEVVALDGSAQPIWSTPRVTQDATAEIRVRIAISDTAPAHADYSDALTFVATGTY